MKTVGLIVIWILMTIILVYERSGIEEMRSFLIIYALLSVYLACMVICYVKRESKMM